MSQPFVAEIRIVGFNFAPKGWAFCDGQLMSISQNTALFSLLGTTYGGDGKSTFGLPNFQGCSPMQPGQSTTGTLYDLGEQSGTSTVTLLDTEMPVHTHSWQASNSDATVQAPKDQLCAMAAGGIVPFAPPSSLVSMSSQSIAPTGGSLPHNNLMPYLSLNMVIALQGVFPPRP